MGIRIKPKEIEIPEGDPFANDLLGRREPIEILTHLVRNIEGPCVMAVDAPWGAGKTTFINLWCQYLRNEGFDAVKFNAWKNDFCNDPFIQLFGELVSSSNFKDKKLGKVTKVAKKLAKHAVSHVVFNIVNYATSGVVNADELLKALKEDTGGTEIKTRLKAYKDTKDAIEEFKEELKGMVSPYENGTGKEGTDKESPQETAASNGKRSGPLIVIIDELDRCRPSYAVELLEVAKHLFSVDHIVFVIAINRQELAHSIRALYGERFNAEDYLRRFFDVDFRLPEPDKEAFINNLFNAIKINDYFKRTEDKKAIDDVGTGQKLLLDFSKAFSFTLRQIEQAVHRVGLVLASMSNNVKSFYLATIAALILRTINTRLYHDFIDGRVSDMEVVEEIFAGSEGKKLQQTHEGCLFEAILILAYKELAESYSGTHPSVRTPLEEKHKDATQKRHAEDVNQLFARFTGDWGEPYRQLGFIHAAKRLELLDETLRDEASE